MNPIYKFELTANGTTQRAFPIYKDDLAKDFEKESGQEFFRAKLSGNLTFESNDYTFIVSKAFDTQFVLEIFISYNAGQTWTSYWRGTFWKTDCEFDGDEQTVKVKPTVLDQYNDVLAGMDKEYNIIELAPEITPVKADKRPMIQVYVPGDTVIGCVQGGIWWEEECEAVKTTDSIIIGGVLISKLTDYLHFQFVKSWFEFVVGGAISPDATGVYSGSGPQHPELAYDVDYTNGNYCLNVQHDIDEHGDFWEIDLYNVNNSNIRWGTIIQGETELPENFTLSPIGTAATGIAELTFRNVQLYMRVISDVEDNGVKIPADDMVSNNRNYAYINEYVKSNAIVIDKRISNSPTKWGQYKEGLYYLPPTGVYSPALVPVARNTWGRYSVWFAWQYVQTDMAMYEKGVTLRHAYPISSVIAVLLGKIAPNISHNATTEYSRFLYATTNPISGNSQSVLITPKSNVISIGYDQPAQQAPITLKDVLDMLRDCFRCYWFIDSNNRFCVEHISYFMNGGAYPGTPDYPVIGMNLTALKVTRNGKPWSYARNQYKFDKPEMAGRYQFGWMDDVTQLFNGYPIDIISNYVNRDNIQNVTINKFSSDFDYILLNPSVISKDGFVLLAATLQSNYVSKSNTVEAITGQNYMNTVQVNIPNGSRYRVRVIGNATIDGNSFWIYRNGNVTYDYATIGVTSTFIAEQNITSIGIGVGGVLVLGGGTLTLYVDVETTPEYKLPYYIIDGLKLQNGFVAFVYLTQYYAYDMPAKRYEINGIISTALGTKKMKVQNINFPALQDPNTTKLIKTEIGDGTIQKLSVNLSSRNANATLKYDTE